MINNYPDGYCVVRNAVPFEEVEHYRNMLLLEIVKYGLSKEQFAEYHNSKTWFPSLRSYVEPLVDHIPSGFKMGTICEPQILLHFPDEAKEWPIQAHRDEEPTWANGRKYRTIAGVALSDQNSANGGLMSWGMEDEPSNAVSVPVRTGDIIIFHPKLWHSGGLNHSGEIRMMIYFRWLGNE